MNKKITKMAVTLGISIALITGVHSEVSANSFKDVSTSNPYYESIEYVKKIGIMNGTDGGEFMPDKTLTRSQIAIVLGNSLKIPKTQTVSLFSDVKNTHEANSYITELTKRGVFQKSEKFNPNQSLTEAQLVKMIVEGYNLKSKKEIEISSIAKTHWAYPYYQTLVELGIMQVNDIKKEKINKPVKREIVASYIYKVKQNEFKPTYYNNIFNKKLMKPAEIAYYIENNFVAQNAEYITVSSKQELQEKLNDIYKELPQKVYISGLNIDDIREVMSNIENKIIPNDSFNNKTLANYRISKSGNKVLISDNSNKKYSAKSIEQGIEEFSNDFAKEISDLDEHSKINIIYNYIFDNFKYNANGFQFMLVGNSYTGEFACNGYSRLFYELSTAAGLDVEIVQGEEHFWNRVTLSNGEVMNVDVTTDDYLNKRYYTLGDNTDTHILKTSETKIYSAKFSQDNYSVLNNLSSPTEKIIKTYKY